MTFAGAAARGRLLQAANDHLAEHGVSGSTLRSIAAAVGTSHRMLIYHFGSLEGLLAEVVTATEARLAATLDAFTADPDLGPADVILGMWRTIAGTSPGYGSMLFELTAHAMQDRPHAVPLRTSLVEPWIEAGTTLFVRAGVPEPDARSRAVLVLGAMRGLLHDALLAGDLESADAAMVELVGLVLPRP